MHYKQHGDGAGRQPELSNSLARLLANLVVALYSCQKCQFPMQVAEQSGGTQSLTLLLLLSWKVGAEEEASQQQQQQQQQQER